MKKAAVIFLIAALFLTGCAKDEIDSFKGEETAVTTETPGDFSEKNPLPKEAFATPPVPEEAELKWSDYEAGGTSFHIGSTDTKVVIQTEDFSAELGKDKIGDSDDPYSEFPYTLRVTCRDGRLYAVSAKTEESKKHLSLYCTDPKTHEFRLENQAESTDFEGMERFFEQLKGISEEWVNPIKDRTEFIACNSFIAGNYREMKQEDKPGADWVEKKISGEGDEIVRKIGTYFDEYTFYVTPENVGELNALEGLPVTGINFYLKTEEIDVSPFLKTVVGCNLGLYPSAVRCSGDVPIYFDNTPENLDFMEAESSDDFRLTLNQYQGDLYQDPRISSYLNSEITLSQQEFNFQNIYFKDCVFDGVVDFSKTTFTPAPYGPWTGMGFDCPGQFAVGLDRMENYSSYLSILLSGNIDFQSYRALRDYNDPPEDHEIDEAFFAKELLQNGCPDKKIILLKPNVRDEEYQKLMEAYPDREFWVCVRNWYIYEFPFPLS